MYENVYTLRTIDGLISNTYVFAIVIAVIFVAISILISNIIAYEGGKNPRDAIKRRIWFFVIAAVNTIVFFIWNYFFIATKIKGAPAVSKFMTHTFICTGITLLAFIVMGFVLSKLMKKGKYGTIFP